MRYRLRTLLIVVALGPPGVGLLVPPIVAWLIGPEPMIEPMGPSRPKIVVRTIPPHRNALRGPPHIDPLAP